MKGRVSEHRIGKHGRLRGRFDRHLARQRGVIVKTSALWHRAPDALVLNSRMTTGNASLAIAVRASNGILRLRDLVTSHTFEGLCRYFLGHALLQNRRRTRRSDGHQNRDRVKPGGTARPAVLHSTEREAKQAPHALRALHQSYLLRLLIPIPGGGSIWLVKVPRY